MTRHSHLGNPIGLAAENFTKSLDLFSCRFKEKSVLSLTISLSPTPKDRESNMSFSHFLSAYDHLCVGFTQAFGTSVYSHPLSLLSSAQYLLKHKYVCVCVWQAGHCVWLRG